MSERKATDILISIEAKMDMILGLLKNQDLNVKVLSNKFNEFVQTSKGQDSPKFTIEAVDAVKIRNDIIVGDPSIKQENPSGERRTSRVNSERDVKTKTPEIIFPEYKAEEVQEPEKVTGGNIPIVQRIVDSAGKVAFLYEVTIMEPDTLKEVFKTRTNATGKWMANLNPGIYKVRIFKNESLSKKAVEAFQTIEVKTGVRELSNFVIKG